MNPKLRRYFPLFLVVLAMAALGWAMSFGTLPPADLTFVNGTEIQSVDPAIVTGQPEGRIVNALFEGLYRPMPDPEDPTSLKPMPGAAESCDISEDRKTYTFTMRKDAMWSNGRAVTTHDFEWSWRRFLHPETGSEYAYQLHYAVGAGQYNSGEVNIGDRVEVELYDRPDSKQLFPRGTIVSGILKAIIKTPEPKFPADTSDEEKEDRLAQWRKRWVFLVDVKQTGEGEIDWEADGKMQRFSKSPEVAKAGDTTLCHHVLLNFSEVGIEAVDEATLVVKLKNVTPYFLDLVAFYPLFPVNRECVEEYKVPAWTKPENIVTNGPFRLKFRRIRDRIRLEKDPTYWGADRMTLNTVDALAVESDVTQLNLYMNGQVDWATNVPNVMIPQLKEREDFHSAVQLAMYFYRVNTRRPPLDDHRVRAALNMAIEKSVITEFVTKGGQEPSRQFVPSGLPGYEGSQCGPYDLEEAKRLLAEAGYPNGEGFRKIELLYNTNEAHRDIAEVIQQQWKKLGINVELKNVAWGVYLDFLSQGKYDIARAGWIGDYPDPNTFLDMFVTDGPNNQTGFSNEHYDALVYGAASEADPKQRMKMFHDAEAILMDNWDDVSDMALQQKLKAMRKGDPKVGGQAIIPIYSYVTINMVRSYVKGAPPYDKYDTGFFGNIQDIHPLHVMSIDQDAKRKELQAEGLR